MKTPAMEGPTRPPATTGDLPLTPDLCATPQRFLWHAATRTAILADLHLGIEQAWQRQGLAIPGMLPAYIPALTRAWAKLIERQPARVLIAGDLFDVPEPCEAAVDLCRRMFRALPAGCRVVITRGNHDPDAAALAGIYAGLPVSVCDHFRIGPHIVSHGHESCDAESHGAPDGNPGLRQTIEQPAATVARFWIVGHQHPAVMMHSRVQAAKMPCFATCSGNPRIIILPAFSRGPLGSDLFTASHWLLPIPRPPSAHIRIAGLIEPADPRQPQVLDFGPLSLLA